MGPQWGLGVVHALGWCGWIGKRGLKKNSQFSFSKMAHLRYQLQTYVEVVLGCAQMGPGTSPLHIAQAVNPRTRTYTQKYQPALSFSLFGIPPHKQLHETCTLSMLIGIWWFFVGRFLAPKTTNSVETIVKCACIQCSIVAIEPQ